MNLMQCSKKHFYDGDKFSECPYCTGATGNFSILNAEIDTSAIKSTSGNQGAQHTPTVVLDDEE
ncbi:hypothetical protein [Pseudobutyrivibrio sp.]|uniref:hypothetical protein n=1 Tax=Pseudobutyrivibrio sp. TaxID=2014367 RepID=UPI001D477CFC|nr:hypothetical protein [Pseudobutyrivibrio sp.]MBE5912005.1 hypothetical protein [Pseudobutyrivibrio sp.]